MLLICLHISENGFFLAYNGPFPQICWTAEQKRIIERSLNTREVFKLKTEPSHQIPLCYYGFFYF